MSLENELQRPSPLPSEPVEEQTPPTSTTPVATIPAATFNYALVAFVALVFGLVIGWVGRDRLAQGNADENRALINEAVAAAVAALPAGPTPAPTRDPNQRFEVSSTGNPAQGPEDAPVTIIEFGDFRCGFCRRFNDETLPQILGNYEGRIRYVYRDYPILSPDSLEAALAAHCANDQSKFWEFHDWMYANQNTLTRDAFIGYATELSMDVEAFTTCLDARTHEQNVITDFQDAQALGITGTPTFFINGKMLVGAQPYNAFAALIEGELSETAS